MPDPRSTIEPRSGSPAPPVILMRLSCFLFLFLAAGPMSAYPWNSTASPQETRLVGSMKSIDFNFLGEHSSYWNLYFGWGLLVGLLLLVMAVLLWLLSDIAHLAPRRVGVMTGLIAAMSGIGAYLSYRFFYVPPLLCFAANALVLLTVTARLLNLPADSALARSANS